MPRSRVQPVDSPVAVVLAGGGARGAYEIGALSALLPRLEARGERPRVIVGTSVGAINAAYLAATADQPLERVLADGRSEEHTSELQSQFHLVCRLLLEKKKKKKNIYITFTT